MTVKVGGVAAPATGMLQFTVSANAQQRQLSLDSQSGVKANLAARARRGQRAARVRERALRRSVVLR